MQQILHLMLAASQTTFCFVKVIKFKLEHSENEFDGENRRVYASNVKLSC